MCAYVTSNIGTENQTDDISDEVFSEIPNVYVICVEDIKRSKGHDDKL